MPSDPPAPAPGPGSLFDPLFTSDAMDAATSPEAWTAALLAFERELARAEADAGVVPRPAAEAVAGVAGRIHPRPGDLGVAARSAGNPVVPLVRALAAAVDDAPGAAGHGAWAHFGATSQDAMDTAAMLVAREGCRLLLADVGAAADACAALARRHRRTLMTGRTLLQPALPITFGLKVAGWLVGLVEAAAVVERVAAERLAVQLGGAAGSLASLGDRGPAVSARLAERLGLAEAPLPWHTDRGRVVELAGALVGLANAAAKVAFDVVLMAQAEVGEVTEGGGGGHGGSSTMPHKANPVSSVLVLAAARRAHGAAAVLVSSGVQDHERAGTGGWHAEWQALTDLLRAAGGCANGVATVVDRLTVSPSRMAANLDRTGGVLMAERVALDLAPELGRAPAAEVVGAASRRAIETGCSFRQALAAEPEVARRRDPGALDRLCEPEGYLGANDELIDRALARHDAWTRSEEGAP